MKSIALAFGTPGAGQARHMPTSIAMPGVRRRSGPHSPKAVFMFNSLPKYDSELGLVFLKVSPKLDQGCEKFAQGWFEVSTKVGLKFVQNRFEAGPELAQSQPKLGPTLAQS